jgi:predicted dehydrogenase
MPPKSKPYRAAVIGCGFIGSRFNEGAIDGNVYSHAAAYKACGDTTLAALCDTNPDRLNEAAAHWGVAATYSDPAHLLFEAKPEIVSICSPDSEHAAHLELALNCPSVKAILCEKPIALDSAPALRLVERAEKSGILLAVNYSRRYDAGHAKVKSLLDRGKLGDIQQVVGYYTKGIIHNGSHMVDLLRWFFGEVVKAEHRGLAGDDLAGVTVDADLVLGDNIHATLRGCDARAYNLFELDIIGKQGRIRLERSGNLITYWRVVKDAHYPGYMELGDAKILSTKIANTTLHAVEDILACLQGERRRPRCTGRDALRALEVTQAMARPHQIPLQELRTNV